MSRGRFAPSPSGQLHIGNLRTALAAWLFARSVGSEFLLRFEDLDPVTSSRQNEIDQMRSLSQMGLDWDGEPIRSSDRFERYQGIVNELSARDLTYRCWCTRREIRDSPQAPHSPPGHYPGTCRHLTAAQQAEREHSGRPAALRLRTENPLVDIRDTLNGLHQETVDDFVLMRGDGVPSYNLVVVVDDNDQVIEQVVRGDDLLSSTPRQAYLADLLGFSRPEWSHVPLVLGEDGERLTKRHGAVGLDDRLQLGDSPERVVAVLASSLGISVPEREIHPGDLIGRLKPSQLIRRPWSLSTEMVNNAW